MLLHYTFLVIRLKYIPQKLDHAADISVRFSVHIYDLITDCQYT